MIPRNPIFDVGCLVAGPLLLQVVKELISKADEVVFPELPVCVV